MPDTPRHPDPAKPAAGRDQPWTEEEKGRGAATGPDDAAGAAGEAGTKGRPTDDRARTEGAAGEIQDQGEPPRKPG